MWYGQGKPIDKSIVERFVVFCRDGQVQTYQNLQSLVQDTVDLSRAAVRTSPFKEHGTTQARHGAQQDGAVEDLSQHLR